RLQASITNADGALKTMTDQRLDTVKGKTELMTSAWEGFILSVDKGDGVFSRFAKSALGTLTDLIDDLQVINDKGLDGLLEKGRKNLSASVKSDQLNKLKESTQLGSVRGSGFGRSFQDDLKGATTVLDNLKEKLKNTAVGSSEFKQIQEDIAASTKRVNDLTGNYTTILDDNTKSKNKNTDSTKVAAKSIPTLEQEISTLQERIKRLAVQYETNPSNSLLSNLNNEISKLQGKESILERSETLIKKLSNLPATFQIKGSLDFPIDDIITDANRKLGEIDAQVKLGVNTDAINDKVGILSSSITSLISQGLDETDPAIQNFQAKLSAIKPPTFLISGSLEDFKFGDILSEVQKKLETVDLNISLGLQADGVAEKITIIKDAMLQLSEAGLAGSDSFAKLNEQLNMATNAQTSMVDVGEILGQNLRALASDTLVHLGESLGNIFSGDGGAAQFFGGMLNIIGDFSVNLGKQLIAIAVAAKAAQSAFLNPVAAAIAGVTLIALGTAAKNYVAKGLPSLAIGTDYVKKDGMAILHKGEKVVPADVVKGGYSRDNNIVEQISLNILTRLKGPDLQYALNYSAPINKRF
ncbi:MAG TPA: hypothetical protein PKD51_16340, partial [Saprospiraceae bacterium]|nr:hypothetical protein [Saprospiraceae bacterium]